MKLSILFSVKWFSLFHTTFTVVLMPLMSDEILHIYTNPTKVCHIKPVLRHSRCKHFPTTCFYFTWKPATWHFPRRLLHVKPFYTLTCQPIHLMWIGTDSQNNFSAPNLNISPTVRCCSIELLPKKTALCTSNKKKFSVSQHGRILPSCVMLWTISSLYLCLGVTKCVWQGL